jgi:hypothetical protein
MVNTPTDILTATSAPGPTLGPAVTPATDTSALAIDALAKNLQDCQILMIATPRLLLQ